MIARIAQLSGSMGNGPVCRKAGYTFVLRRENP